MPASMPAEYLALEDSGIIEAGRSAFVLVAGGLGERLGYSGEDPLLSGGGAFGSVHVSSPSVPPIVSSPSMKHASSYCLPPPSLGCVRRHQSCPAHRECNGNPLPAALHPVHPGTAGKPPKPPLPSMLCKLCAVHVVSELYSVATCGLTSRMRGPAVDRPSLLGPPS